MILLLLLSTCSSHSVTELGLEFLCQAFSIGHRNDVTYPVEPPAWDSSFIVGDVGWERPLTLVYILPMVVKDLEESQLVSCPMLCATTTHINKCTRRMIVDVEPAPH